MFRRDRTTSTSSQQEGGPTFSRTSSHQNPSIIATPPQTPPTKDKRRSFFGLGGGNKDKHSSSSAHGHGHEGGKGMLGVLGRTTSRLSTNGEEYASSFTSAPTPPPQAGQQMTREQWEAYQRQQQQHEAQLRAQGGRPPQQQQQHLQQPQPFPSSASNPSTAGSTPPPPPIKEQDRQLQQQQQQPSQDLARRNSLEQHPDSGPTPPKSLGELQFALDLIMAQPNKVYATSPPTLKSMVAAGADGKHPRAGPPGTPGNDWQEVWVELRGIILHVWNMKEVAEANARGQDKHPNRINTTDSFVDLIQPLPPTRHDPSSGPHPFVFSINTAGLNSVLFSCPNKEIMMEWVTAIRLAGYESSRLMEIYTGHLIRSVGVPLPPLSQNNNRIAGWFDVRTFGSRSWTHLWVVLSVEGPPGSSSNTSSSHPAHHDTKSGASKSKNRISRLFGGSSSPEPVTTPYPPVPGESSPTGMGARRPSEMSLAGVAAGGRPVVSAQFYTSPPKSTISKSPASSGLVPFLTVTDVSQAFAVFPEVETEIDHSAMFKVEGHLTGEAMGTAARRDEGWILMIPMEKEGETFTSGKRSDMLRWLAAFHDAFNLYGRPGNYSWDARDPRSLLFAHPHGDNQDDLFITKPIPNPDEISISRASFVRSRFRDTLVRKMNGQPPLQYGGGPPGANPSQLRQPALQGVPEAPENGSRVNTPRDSVDGGRGSIESGGGGVAAAPPAPAQAPQVAPAPKSSTFQLPPFSFGDDESASPPTSNKVETAAALPSSPPPRSHLRESASPVPESSRTKSPTTNSSFSQAQQRPDQQQQHQRQGSSSSSFLDRPVDRPVTNGSGYAQQQTNGSGSGSNKSASMQVLPGTMDVRPLRTDYQLDENESPNLVTSPDSYHPPSSFAQATPAPSSPPQAAAPRSIVTSPPPEPVKNDFAPGSDDEIYGVATVARPGAFNAVEDPRPQQQQQNLYASSSAPRTESIPSGSIGHRSLDPRGVDARNSPVPSQSSQRVPLLSPDLARSPEMSSSRPVSSSGHSAPVDVSSVRTPPTPSGAFEVSSSPPSATSVSSGKREMVNLGRRPSGARAAPGRRVVSEAAGTMPVVSDEEEAVPPPRDPSPAPPVVQQQQKQSRRDESEDQSDHNADALAALSFLDATSPSATSPVKTRALPPQPRAVSQASREDLPPIQTSFSPPPEPARIAQQEQQAFPSSFGPGKSAAERRAKAEASEKQRDDALTKPGKGKAVAGRNKSAKRGNNWAQSSEEDEDDDDEGSVDSGPRRPTSSYPQQPQASSQSQSDLSARGGVGLGRPLPNPGQQQQSSRNFTDSGDSRRPESNYDQYQSQYDRGRQQDLQPPRPAFANGGSSSRSPSGYDQNYGGNGNGGNGQRASSYSGYESDHQLHQPVPRPGAINGGGPSKSRSSVWTNHLENTNPHGGRAEETNSAFVEVEAKEGLTKAFNPNGLLQAGLEDRNDRSAKRQEELARETGGSLVNVPSKPPPPQTGLLGAITAHERDRAREGGVGAAMTERERDRRAAEERARKIDALQREQLEAMSAQQGGSPGPYGYNPYGQQQQGGMQPGMMPPWGMGMGMPQMGGGSAYGGYGGGMDPQMAAMMAAQAAYQQAMMSYSQAGSQVGGDDIGRASSPMMGGGGMGMGGPGMGGPQMGMGWGMPPWGAYGGGMPYGMGGGMGGMPSPNNNQFLPPNPYGGGSQSGHSPAPSFHNQPRNGSPDHQQAARSRLNSSSSKSPLNPPNGPPSSGGGGGASRSSTPRSNSRANLGN